MNKNNLITRKGWTKINTELKELKYKTRPEVTKVVAWAASLGDRSENADYKENKRLLRQIDKRINYLTKKIRDAQVVEYAKEQEGAVYFGATVVLEDQEGKTLKCKIVGVDEIDTKINHISVISPIASAILGKKINDQAKVNAETVTCVTIKKIYYQQD